MPKSPSPHTPSRSAKYFSFCLATSAIVRTNSSVPSMLVPAMASSVDWMSDCDLPARRSRQNDVEIGDGDQARWTCLGPVRRDPCGLAGIANVFDDERRLREVLRLGQRVVGDDARHARRRRRLQPVTRVFDHHAVAMREPEVIGSVVVDVRGGLLGLDDIAGEY